MHSVYRRDASGMREVSVQHFPTPRTFVVDCFANGKFSTVGCLSPAIKSQHEKRTLVLVKASVKLL